MASIAYDRTTHGKWRVRWTDERGEERENFCDSHAQAQAYANAETRYQLRRAQGLCPSDSSLDGKHAYGLLAEHPVQSCLYCGKPQN